MNTRVALLTLALLAPASQAGDLAAAFPADPLAVARAPSGRAVWESPPAQRILAKLRDSGALAELEKGRAALKLASGSDPADWLAFLFGGEVEAAVYAPTAPGEDGSGPRRLLVAARTSDADACQHILDALLAVLESDRSRDVHRGKHRDAPTARVGHDLSVAREGDVLLLASTQDLLETAIDRLLDGAPPVLSMPAADGLLDFGLQPELLQPRDERAVAGPARRALGPRIANPLGNLLFGGLLSGDGPVTGALDADASALELRLALPGPPADAPAAWFPAGAPGFSVPVDSETVAVLAVRRDLADWWRHRETLLSEEAQAQLAKADQTISILFMGASPAEDIFAGVREELALVVDRQVFAGGAAPAVRLPGACLVARARDPATLGPRVQVAFQTFVGFLNTDRAQKHETPFLIDAVEHEGVTIRAARLLAGAHGETPVTDANASPAVALAGDTLLIGTSLEQVERLVTALHAGTLRAVAGGPFCAQVDAARALQIAHDDHDVLVAKSVLEDGLDPSAAAARLDRLLGLAGELRSLELVVAPVPDRLAVRLRVELGAGAP